LAARILLESIASMNINHSSKTWFILWINNEQCCYYRLSNLHKEN
jgi:hypothetical protein